MDYFTKEAIKEYERKKIYTITYHKSLLDKYGLLNLRKKHILDIGCGFGYTLSLFKGCKLYGIDKSSIAVKESQKNLNKKAIIKKWDITKGIPFKTKFDVIYSFGTFGLIDKKNYRKIISAIYTHLNSNGIALITTPNGSRPNLIVKILRLNKNRMPIERWTRLISEFHFSSFSIKPILRVPLTYKIFGNHIFLETKLGDPLVIYMKK
ncbi:MAG: class I SAM-dependent methyltransferase [Candidatus Micrarchaeia archaeon]